MIATTTAPEILVVDDALFDEHHSRGYHPERPERLHAARTALDRCATEGLPTKRIATRDATEDELIRVHNPAYIEALNQLAGHFAALDPDTYLAPTSVAAAKRAAGASIALVDAILDPKNTRKGAAPPPGLALLRPPGHHATRAKGMGFCLLNNVAVAAADAIAKGLSRIAIIDWDVHHGNGTQDIFWNDPRVLYVSLHQHPYYPGTGNINERGGSEANGYSVNVPLSQGAGDAVYTQAFQQLIDPLLDAFVPELILVSAGFDAHQRDPLADMCVTDEGFAAMSTILTHAALKHTKGKIAFFLEGGYDLTALSTSLAETMLASANAAASHNPTPAKAPLSFRHNDEIQRARKTAAETWRGL